VADPVPVSVGAGVSPLLYWVDELEVLLGVHRRTIARWEELGEFPRRVPVPGGCRAYDRGEVDEWFARLRGSKD